MLVWLADRLVPADRAVVSVFDRGFRSGEGVFETIRAYGTHPFRLDAHLDRAAAGARALGFEIPERESLVEAVEATAAANAGDSDLALRLTVTPGPVDPESPFPGTGGGPPTVVVTAHPLRIDPDVYERGVRAALIKRTRELPTVKAVSYVSASLARHEALARGAAEALLTSPDGHVLEGSYSNVFAVVSDRLLTPPADAGILPGVTRAVVLELASRLGLDVEEAPLPATRIQAADEVFLTASTREIVPVVRIDDEPVGSSRPGELTARLLRAYRDEVAQEIARRNAP